MALIAVFSRDSTLRWRYARALEPAHALAYISSWKRLIRVVRERPVTTILVDVSGLPGLGALRRLLKAYPNLGIILLATGTDPRDLFQLGRTGVKHLVLPEVDEEGERLFKALAEAGKSGVKAEVLRVLSRQLPRREMLAVALAVEGLPYRWSAEEYSRQVGLTRPVLSERFKRCGLPSVGHFLLWVRLFYAGHWLVEPGRTAQSVSRQLEYSSGAAFRRALKLYTGATPTQVIDRGGLSFVLQRFRLTTGLGRAPVPMIVETKTRAASS